MTSIEAKARNVRELLGGKKYTIDYFQREYRWGSKHIGELITDLTARFLTAWNPDHDRSAVAQYPGYFLGSIIVSEQGGRSSVIDGQQRLTSLSILLIWVLHGLTEEDRRSLSDLIFTRQYGSNSYNLDVPERTAAMDSLYRQQAFNRDDAPESVRNLLDRYEDIAEQMPQEIIDDARPFFADWLIERVYLVEIKTPSDDDGYAVFETMNDRGLPLSPTEMLKSHLLAHAGSEETRARLNGLWKQRIDQLLQLGKEADADAIKGWLRAKHAETIREREAGATPQDFERIGTEFHRWVREAGPRLHLVAAADFGNFVDREFHFYTGWYLRFQDAAASLVAGREAIYCNNLANFTLQFALMLAPLRLEDSEEVAWRKANLVATFVDILITRRLWHGRAIDYNTMQYAMFQVMKEIRGKQPSDIAESLRTRITKDTQPFSVGTGFGLWQANRKTVRRFLARLTTWLDTQLGLANNLSSYLTSSGPQGFDIEHVVADQYERDKDGFKDEKEFQEGRNRIGALLLLPKSFNRSYGDLSYEQKRRHYLQQNALAQTLHEDAYERNPRLRKLIEEGGLPFIPYAQFGKDQIAARDELYACLAERVWSVTRLEEGAKSIAERA